MVLKKNLLTLGLLLLSVTILGGCSSNQASSNQTQTTTKSESLVDSTKVSLKSAISLYQKTYPDSDITSIELDKTVGKPVYEIEGVDDNKEYKLSINAKNKKILRKKTENLDDDEQNGQARKDDKVKLDKLLSLNKITKIAEKKLKNSQAKEFSLEQELGVTYWEVNVKHGSKEKEVKINAITGKILNTEND